MRDLTARVINSFSTTEDDRLRFVLTKLVEHLHDFARDVQLSEEEWERGIEFLTQAGDITDEDRQEFILLSDVLGLSMLTVGINQPGDETVSESTVLGPFFREGAPHVPLGGDLAQGASGPPTWISGQLVDQHGASVGGARIDVWESDDEGFYDVQREGRQFAGRGHLVADDEGRFNFWSVLPSPYPIPADGPVGHLLELTGRSPMRPAHIHFMVRAHDCRTLITHIFVEGSPHLDNDAVFGFKPSLIVPFEEHAPGTGPDGREVDRTWYTAHVRFVLAREDQ